MKKRIKYTFLTIIPILLSSCNFDFGEYKGNKILNELKENNLNLKGKISKTAYQVIDELNTSKSDPFNLYIDYTFDNQNEYFISKDNYYKLENNKVIETFIDDNLNISYRDSDLVLSDIFYNPFRRFNKAYYRDSKLELEETEVISFINSLYEIESSIENLDSIYDLEYSFSVNKNKLTKITFSFKTKFKSPDGLFYDYLLPWIVYEGEIEVKYNDIDDADINSLYEWKQEEFNNFSLRQLNADFSFPNIGFKVNLGMTPWEHTLLFTYNDKIYLTYNLDENVVSNVYVNYYGLAVKAYLHDGKYKLKDEFFRINRGVVLFEDLLPKKNYSEKDLFSKAYLQYLNGEPDAIVFSENYVKENGEEYDYRLMEAFFDLNSTKPIILNDFYGSRHSIKKDGHLVNQILFCIFFGENKTSQSHYDVLLNSFMQSYHLCENEEYNEIMTNEMFKIMNDLNL